MGKDLINNKLTKNFHCNTTNSLDFENLRDEYIAYDEDEINAAIALMMLYQSKPMINDNTPDIAVNNERNSKCEAPSKRWTSSTEEILPYDDESSSDYFSPQQEIVRKSSITNLLIRARNILKDLVAQSDD